MIAQPEVKKYALTAPQTPEMTARPEVNNEPLNCSPDPGNDRATGSQEMIPILLYCTNGINGLYICVGCCTLTLVVPLWGDFNQCMRVE